jgi:hypothetical protein
MMKPALLRWLLWQTLPVTSIAVPIFALFVALYPGPIFWMRDTTLWILILLHGYALHLCLGRPRSSSMAHLYCHGFSRQTLWRHVVVATWLAILAAWIPMAALIWSPARVWIQTRLLNNQNFFVLAPLEQSSPVFILIAEMVWMAVLNYAWVREAQPFRGLRGGRWLTRLFVIVALLMPFTQWDRIGPSWLVPSVMASWIIVGLIAFWGALRLQGRMEVRV